jgi:hypothetical protein
MAKFLDSSEEVEKPLLNAVGRQSQKIVDELLPQIRLASFENEGACVMDLRIGFEFAEDGKSVTIASEGIVNFPAKRAYAETEASGE